MRLCVRRFSQLPHVPLPLAAKARRNGPALDSLFSVQIDDKGEYKSVETTRLDLATELKLPLRDLRCLEETFKIAQVVVRPKHAIICNLKYARALIVHDSVMLVARSSEELPTQLVEEIVRRLRNPFLPRNADFEFLVLEGLLHYSHERLRRELDTLLPQIRQLLTTLEMGEPDQMAMRALLHYSKQLSLFKYDVSELREALNAVLMADEDLAGLYLTSYAATGHARRIDQHEDAELLFEAYTKRLQENSNDISEMQSNVSATEEYIKIRFDGQRNNLMRMNLQLTMATFSASLGAIGVGAFGMNLVSHLEENPVAFYAVSGGVAAACVGSFLALKRAQRKMGL